MNAVEWFACPECGELSGTRVNAMLCCADVDEAVSQWICDECETPYDDKASADACCAEESA